MHSYARAIVRGVRMRRWSYLVLDGVLPRRPDRLITTTHGGAIAHGVLSASIPTSRILSAEEQEVMLAFKRQVVKARLDVLVAEREVLLLRRQELADMHRMEAIARGLEGR